MIGSPMLHEKAFEPDPQHEVDHASTMTISGTISAALVLVVILLAAATVGWLLVEPGRPGEVAPPGWLFAVVVAAAGVAIWAGLRPAVSPFAAPLYAAMEGVVLGAISHVYELQSEGVVLQAVGATVAVLLVQLVLHASGLVRATPRFIEVLVAAALGTILLYAVVLVADAAGLHASFLGTESHVLVSLVSAGVAAFFLFADFAMIEQGAQERAPKFMEWYAALGLVLTLVWLYLELLALMGDEDGGGD